MLEAHTATTSSEFMVSTILVSSDGTEPMAVMKLTMLMASLMTAIASPIPIPKDMVKRAVWRWLKISYGVVKSGY